MKGGESHPEPRFGGKDTAVNRLPADQRAFLLPGEFIVTKTPMIFSTILGSCVAACLYDPVAKVAGMNHFLLPVRRVSEGPNLGATAEGRYGIEAMELLINAMLKAGAVKARFHAKIFGGASIMPKSGVRKTLAIGEANCRFVREFLRIEGIPVDAEGLGGYQGRWIHFHTDTFSVWHRRIQNQAVEAEVARTEAQVWRRAADLLRSSGNPILF